LLGGAPLSALCGILRMSKAAQKLHKIVVEESPHALSRTVREFLSDGAPSVEDQSDGALPAKPKKKRAPQSPLDLMPLHQKQALTAWLTTGGPAGQGITYKEAQTRLKTEFGIHAEVSALCGYFQRTQRSATPMVEVSVSPDRHTLTIRINIQRLSTV